jgi:hypothetical protein
LEIDTLTKMECWDVVDRPKNRSIVSSTWAFKIKCFPDGSVRKFRARGLEQVEGSDFDETFAPVVSWTTVRFLLMMSILLGLATKQVDYIDAFVQARQFTLKCREASLNQVKTTAQEVALWFETKPEKPNKLKSLGFKSSEADPCLFASNSCICLFYVDDTRLFARSQVEIEDVVQGLKNLGMNLEEYDAAGFFGVLIRRHPGTSPTIELL